MLTAVPCVDRPEDHAMQKNEISQSQSEHQHHDGDDHCSPFCTCNCCASPVIQQDFSINFESYSYLQASFSPAYSSQFVSFYSGSIWQPPQLS